VAVLSFGKKDRGCYLRATILRVLVGRKENLLRYDGALNLKRCQIKEARRAS
jgi:hypothetical protein